MGRAAEGLGKRRFSGFPAARAEFCGGREFRAYTRFALPRILTGGKDPPPVLCRTGLSGALRRAAPESGEHFPVFNPGGQGVDKNGGRRSYHYREHYGRRRFPLGGLKAIPNPIPAAAANAASDSKTAVTEHSPRESRARREARAPLPVLLKRRSQAAKIPRGRSRRICRLRRSAAELPGRGTGRSWKSRWMS